MSIIVKKYNLLFFALYLLALLFFIIIAKGELVPVGLMLVFVSGIGFPGPFSLLVKEKLSDNEISLLAKNYGAWTTIVTLLTFVLSIFQYRVYLSDIQLLGYVLVIFILIPLFGYLSRFSMYVSLVKIKDYRSESQ